jgi:signal peptidase II
MYRDFSISALIISLIIAIDQTSKDYIYSQLLNKQIIQITNFFSIVNAWNYGVSFGFLNRSTTNKWLLIIVSLILVGFLFHQMQQSTLPRKIIYSIIIGGALGNALDRIRYGAVYDFLDFHCLGWHYPTFNIADIFIVIGVALWLYIDTRSKVVLK